MSAVSVCQQEGVTLPSPDCRAMEPSPYDNHVKTYRCAWRTVDVTLIERRVQEATGSDCDSLPCSLLVFGAAGPDPGVELPEKDKNCHVSVILIAPIIQTRWVSCLIQDG